MLRINQGQISTFEALREASFVQRLVKHIAKDLSAEYKRLGFEGTPEEFVSAELSLARGYGLMNADDLKAYLDCSIVFGPRFDADLQMPWAGLVLMRTDLSGTNKADVLHDHLVFDHPWPIPDSSSR